MPTWELITVCTILVLMLIALVDMGDRLDHWTYMGQDLKPKPVKVYGMSLKQIRQLRAFYISRTGDTKLDRLDGLNQ